MQLSLLTGSLYRNTTMSQSACYIGYTSTFNMQTFFDSRVITQLISLQIMEPPIVVQPWNAEGEAVTSNDGIKWSLDK